MEYKRNRIRLLCRDCEWCEATENVSRCLIESNLRTNWMGTIYIQHPDWKNYNGACIDYRGKNETL